ncbi:hypothetical protein FS594_08730 [Rahnella aquatilis]|nr:hypothetical protein FS594_08730 [Rahnella aquatilis]
MNLKFEVGSINTDIRSEDSKTSFNESALILLGKCIETVETRITVTGMPNSKNEKVRLTIDYFEEYAPQSTLANFKARAVSFAQDYCADLGLVGKATL